MLYDTGVSQPGSAWTDQHSAQGFIRRDGVVCFGTLLECGTAHVEIIHGDYVSGEFERVIRCPIHVTSGSVWVTGPEIWPEPSDYRVLLSPGLFAVTCAQSVSGDDELRVALYFHSTDITHSRILVADPDLRPCFPLLETGEVAIP